MVGGSNRIIGVNILQHFIEEGEGFLDFAFFIRNMVEYVVLYLYGTSYTLLGFDFSIRIFSKYAIIE